MRLPDFIIIGGMKCATSTLHDQLALQPGIFMSTPKEPYFFSDDPVYAKGIEWYASLFSDAPENAICGESTTHYTKLPTYPHTIERIQQHVPNARFVYVIRHPVDRLISQYIHEWTEKKITLPIDDAIDKHPELTAYSRYSMQLQPYVDAFGFDQILLVPFAGIRRQPQQELERVCRFIGYEPAPQWRADEEPKNASNQRLKKNAFRDAIVWNPVVTTLRRALVPQAARDWVKSLWQMKSRPSLSNENENRLVQIFDEDLAHLSAWIGRDMTCANFEDSILSAPLDWRPSLATTSAA